jgi:hypothetical protein
MWNGKSGAMMNVFAGHSDAIVACSFTGDGSKVRRKEVGWRKQERKERKEERGERHCLDVEGNREP